MVLLEGNVVVGMHQPIVTASEHHARTALEQPFNVQQEQSAEEFRRNGT